jgi:hypothetical protein
LDIEPNLIAYFQGNVYTLSLTVNPQNTTSSISVSLSSSGNDTNPVITWNAKFTNGTCLYGSNQTYSGTTSMAINDNATDVLFFAHVGGDNSTQDYKEVTFSVTISRGALEVDTIAVIVTIAALVTAIVSVWYRKAWKPKVGVTGTIRT